MPKSKIQNCPSWMIAWNLLPSCFALHACPSLSHISTTWLANFNLPIFTSTTRPNNEWQITAQKDIIVIINHGLFNMYLNDNYLPSCFHCHTYRHYATSCPFKSNHASLTSNNTNFHPLSNNNSDSLYPTKTPLPLTPLPISALAVNK